MRVNKHRSSSATPQSTIVPGISSNSFYFANKLSYSPIIRLGNQSFIHPFFFITGKLVPLSPVGATIPNGKGAVLRSEPGGYPLMLIQQFSGHQHFWC